MNAKLIVFSGPPCSGKSTLAEQFHRKTGIVHLELDQLRSRLLPDSRQDQMDRDITYRAMHLIAEYLLKAGQPVILDATYGREVHRRAVRELGQGIVIQCRVAPDLAVQRFRARAPGHFAVDLTEELVRQLAEQYVYGGDAVVIDTSRPVEVCLREIEAKL